MKTIVGILFITFMAGGIYFGYLMGKNDDVSVESSKNEPTAVDTEATAKSSSNDEVLDLSGSGLTEVTSDIYSKTRTTELILSNNSIQTLPSEMGKMTNLEIFKINNNKLDGSLIGEIRQMFKLTQLDVSYNNMTGMPAEIGQLTKLQTLNYSHNSISGLPNELSNLKNNLKEFNLTGNPLSQDQIDKLKTDLPDTEIIF